MTVPWALAAPVIIFLLLIVPLWITFHYLTVWRRMGSEQSKGAGADAADLERMREVAERLERRLDSLETILDAESPDWRHK